VAEVSIGKGTDDSSTPYGVAKSSLPGGHNLTDSARIALTVPASEGWLGEERVDEDDVVAFHDDTGR
jgi:hypothetical protein